MDYTIHTLKTTLYSILVTIILSLLPLAGSATPQHNDITMPTRERVNKRDNKATDKKQQKTSDKKEKEEVKQPAAVKKEEPQKEEPKAPVTPSKKEEQGKQPVTDTTAKTVTPPKPKPTTLNPDNVKFDGIDISKYQGNINWEELKRNSRIKFIYIKATEGSDYVDPRYHENIRNARKHGFKVGSYHFLSTSSAATTQFYNFIRTAKREDQDLLPVIDVENLKPWSPQQLRDSIKVFADLIEDYYGCKPLIYTSEKFFTSHLGRAFSHYPLFIAKYSNSKPEIGYKWILWQFADNGLFKAVKGNYGKVDMSRFAAGCSINDILYNPSKHKPRISSVKDAVDHKDKPDKVNMTEQKAKEAPKMSKKQQEEAQRQAEKEKKAKERNKKIAEDEAKKKAEADKKAKQKAEQQKREKAKQQAREQEAKKEAARKEAAKKEAEAKAKKEAEAKAKKEAEAKAKRKADAQKAREQKAQRNASSKTSKTNKAASLMNSNTSKLTQSQRNDSIRNAKYKGRKTNKSSADND